MRSWLRGISLLIVAFCFVINVSDADASRSPAPKVKIGALLPEIGCKDKLIMAGMCALDHVGDLMCSQNCSLLYCPQGNESSAPECDFTFCATGVAELCMFGMLPDPQDRESAESDWR